MSAHHRQLLKRRYRDSREIEDAAELEHGRWLASQRADFSTAADTQGASAQPTAAPMDTASVCDDVQPTVDAERVGPEGGDQGAVLDEGAAPESPSAPSDRAAAWTFFGPGGRGGCSPTGSILFRPRGGGCSPTGNLISSPEFFRFRLHSNFPGNP